MTTLARNRDKVPKRKRNMEKLKEWGPLLAAFAAVMTLTLLVAVMLVTNANRNADTRHEALMRQIEAQRREADTRHEATMALLDAQKRDADTRHEALMGLIEAQNRIADARYEGLMGQIEGVLGQVVGLQNQIDGLQNQIDGLNRNADATGDGLKEQVESAMNAIEALGWEIDSIYARHDIGQRSVEAIRANVNTVEAMLEALHERVAEIESMDELDEAGFDTEFERQKAQPVTLERSE